MVQVVHAAEMVLENTINLLIQFCAAQLEVMGYPLIDPDGFYQVHFFLSANETGQ